MEYKSWSKYERDVVWLKNILVDAGEKMGLQITVLLSDIIYVDILQSTVPVFDSFGNAPLILSFFIVSILMLTVCLLGMSYTLASFYMKCSILYAAYST